MPGLMLAVVALVTLQVRVVLAPGAIEVADAEMLAAGLGAGGPGAGGPGAGGGLEVPPSAGEAPPPQPVNRAKKERSRMAR
jgi:hypothetical protein